MSIKTKKDINTIALEIEEINEKYVKPSEKYQHYKGAIYQVISISYNVNDSNYYVNYFKIDPETLFATSPFIRFSRRLNSFMGQVGNGERRFILWKPAL